MYYISFLMKMLVVEGMGVGAGASDWEGRLQQETGPQ